jgi:hypothetical protein
MCLLEPTTVTREPIVATPWSSKTHTPRQSAGTHLWIALTPAVVIIRCVMTRPVAVLILGCFLPAVAGHPCSVDVNDAQLSGSDGSAASEKRGGGESFPTDEGPVKEPVPAEDLAVRSGPLQVIERTSRAPESRRVSVRPFGRRIPQTRHGDPPGDRLERVVTQARCVTASLLVVAPLVRSHAPPCVS